MLAIVDDLGDLGPRRALQVLSENRASNLVVIVKRIYVCQEHQVTGSGGDHVRESQLNSLERGPQSLSKPEDRGVRDQSQGDLPICLVLPLRAKWQEERARFATADQVGDARNHARGGEALSRASCLGANRYPRGSVNQADLEALEASLRFFA